MERPAGLTDMEIFAFYYGHLKNPCSVVVDGERHDIRLFLEELAKEALPRITNPYLRSLLGREIKGCFKRNIPFAFLFTEIN